MPARRSVLASIGLGLTGAFGGCSTIFEAFAESTSNETEQKSVSPPAAAKSASTATGEAASTTEGEFASLPEECVTDEFVGVTSTTPRPVPDRPDDPTTESALEYALAYERHYLAYRVMYALGPQTPDSQTDGPAHDFPDVRLGEVDAKATQRSGDRVVVRLTYDRLFEGESQGEFTVKYSVSADRTVRAATDGRVSRGPDLAENGRIQHCGA